MPRNTRRQQRAQRASELTGSSPFIVSSSTSALNPIATTPMQSLASTATINTLQKYSLSPPPLELSTNIPTLRFGDYYLQTKHQVENNLNNEHIRSGYVNVATIENETLNGYPIIQDRLKQENFYFSKFLLSKLLKNRKSKMDQNSFQSISTLPRINMSEEKELAWIQTFSNTQYPLSSFLEIPSSFSGEILLGKLTQSEVPYSRALWLVKMIGLSEIRSNRNREKASEMYTIEWTRMVLSFLFKLIAQVNQKLLQDQVTSEECLNIRIESFESKISKLKSWRYSMQLTILQYHEGLLEQRHFLKMLLDYSTQCDIYQFGILIPFLRIFVIDYTKSRMLSKMLIESCYKNLSMLQSSPSNEKFRLLQNEIKSIIQLTFAASPDLFVAPKRWKEEKNLLISAFSTSMNSQTKALLINTIKEKISRVTQRNEIFLTEAYNHSETSTISVHCEKFVRLLPKFKNEESLRYCELAFSKSSSQKVLARKVLQIFDWIISPSAFSLATKSLCICYLFKIAISSNFLPSELLQNVIFTRIGLDMPIESDYRFTQFLGDLISSGLFNYELFGEHLLSRKETLPVDKLKKYKWFIKHTPLDNSSLFSLRTTLIDNGEEEIGEVASIKCLYKCLFHQVKECSHSTISHWNKYLGIVQYFDSKTLSALDHCTLFEVSLSVQRLATKIMEIASNDFLLRIDIEFTIRQLFSFIGILEQTQSFQTMIKFSVWFLSQPCTYLEASFLFKILTLHNREIAALQLQDEVCKVLEKFNNGFFINPGNVDKNNDVPSLNLKSGELNNEQTKKFHNIVDEAIETPEVLNEMADRLILLVSSQKIEGAALLYSEMLNYVKLSVKVGAKIPDVVSIIETCTDLLQVINGRLSMLSVVAKELSSYNHPDLWHSSLYLRILKENVKNPGKMWILFWTILLIAKGILSLPNFIEDVSTFLNESTETGELTTSRMLIETLTILLEYCVNTIRPINTLGTRHILSFKDSYQLKVEFQKCLNQTSDLSLIRILLQSLLQYKSCGGHLSSAGDHSNFISHLLELVISSKHINNVVMLNGEEAFQILIKDSYSYMEDSFHGKSGEYLTLVKELYSRVIEFSSGIKPSEDILLVFKNYYNVDVGLKKVWLKILVEGYNHDNDGKGGNYSSRYESILGSLVTTIYDDDEFDITSFLSSTSLLSYHFFEWCLGSIIKLIVFTPEGDLSEAYSFFIEKKFNQKGIERLIYFVKFVIQQFPESQKATHSLTKNIISGLRLMFKTFEVNMIDVPTPNKASVPLFHSMSKESKQIGLWLQLRLLAPFLCEVVEAADESFLSWLREMIEMAMNPVVFETNLIFELCVDLISFILDEIPKDFKTSLLPILRMVQVKDELPPQVAIKIKQILPFQVDNIYLRGLKKSDAEKIHEWEWIELNGTRDQKGFRRESPDATLFAFNVTVVPNQEIPHESHEQTLSFLSSQETQTISRRSAVPSPSVGSPKKIGSKRTLDSHPAELLQHKKRKRMSQ